MLKRPRVTKHDQTSLQNSLIVIAIDIFLVAVAWYVANLLRFNFEIPPDSTAAITHFLPVILGIQMVVFYAFNLYKGMFLGDVGRF